jgi:hypothetical protein
MSNVKLLISSLPAVGKTTLLQTLEDVLVIARDGKQYPFPQAHVNVPDFDDVDQLIDLVVEKVDAYEEKMGSQPKTIAFDSCSKMFLDIEAYVLQQVKSFPYGKVNTEIQKLVNFIERDVVPNFNVVLVSHAMYNEEINGYQLVNAGGSFGKKGGLLSEVDEGIFLELRGKARNVHFRNSKMCARTTAVDLPDMIPSEEFNLQEHLEMLMAKQSDAKKWSL